MWKQLSKLKDTGYLHFHEGRIFAAKKNDGKNVLSELSNDFEVIWESPEFPISSFYVYDGLIFYSIYKSRLVARPLDNLSTTIYEYNFPFSFNINNVSRGTYLGNVKNLGFIEFDLKSYNVINMTVL